MLTSGLNHPNSKTAQTKTYVSRLVVFSELRAGDAGYCSESCLSEWAELLLFFLFDFCFSPHLILSQIYISNTFARVITLNHTLQFQRANKMHQSASIDKCTQWLLEWKERKKYCIIKRVWGLKTFHLIWCACLSVIFFFFFSRYRWVAI